MALTFAIHQKCCIWDIAFGLIIRKTICDIQGGANSITNYFNNTQQSWKWRHRSEAFKCLVTLECQMQIPDSCWLRQFPTVYLDLYAIINVSINFHPRLEKPPKVKFHAWVSSRVPFLYLQNKPNLAFLSNALTSSNNMANLAALRYKGHSSVVM